MAIVLGAHGLYTHFQWSSVGNPIALGFIFGMSGVDPEWYFSRLFLSVDVPSAFKPMVLWASARGLESWFIPSALIVAGIFAFYLQNKIYSARLRLPRAIEKLRARLWYRKSYYDKHPHYQVKDKANLRKKIIKTLLCITAIAIFVFLIWSCFFVFQRKEHPIWGLNPIAGAVAILVGIVVLILNIRVLRSYRYRWTAPSFKLVVAMLVVIFLVCAFAGVQPLSNYKDDAISGIKNAFRGQTEQSSVQTLNSKQIGPWLYTLHNVKRGSTTAEVTISIRNVGGQPLVWDSGSVGKSYPDFICVDEYNQYFAPENNSWYWMRKIYPDETVKGTIKYQLHEMSGEIRLYLGSNFAFLGCVPYWFLFDLK
jgi:hypothetical protein